MAAVLLLHPVADLRAVEGVEPVRATGTLEVRSIEGAQVEIDGRPRGEVPVTVDLPEGEYRVRVTAPGHHPWLATMQIRAGADLAVVTELVRLRAAEPPVLPPRVEAEAARPPAADVFLTTKKRSVFLPPKSSAPEASTFLPATHQRVGVDPFLAAKRDDGEAPVFLATKRKSVFLAPKEERASADDLLPSRPAAAGDVFMPVRRPSPSLPPS